AERHLDTRSRRRRGAGAAPDVVEAVRERNRHGDADDQSTGGGHRGRARSRFRCPDASRRDVLPYGDSRWPRARASPRAFGRGSIIPYKQLIAVANSWKLDESAKSLTTRPWSDHFIR